MSALGKPFPVLQTPQRLACEGGPISAIWHCAKGLKPCMSKKVHTLPISPQVLSYDVKDEPYDCQFVVQQLRHWLQASLKFHSIAHPSPEVSRQFLISFCQIKGNLLLLQLEACSIVSLWPQMQWDGRR